APLFGNTFVSWTAHPHLGCCLGGFFVLASLSCRIRMPLAGQTRYLMKPTHSSNSRRSLRGLFALVGLLLVGCNSRVPSEQTTPAREAISSATSKLERAFAQTNSVGIASQYMQDGEVLLASEPAVRDRDNIADFFGNFLLHTGATKIQFKANQF